MTFVALSLAALFGGCQCEVKRVYVGFDSCGSDDVIALGDSIRLWAQAHSSEQPVGFSTLFTSYSHPDRFRWATDPESLAIITAPARVRTLRTGDVVVSATADGVTGSRTLKVVPSPGTVRYAFPAAIRVGDTVRVEFRMLDEQGVELIPTGRARIHPEPKHLTGTVDEATPGLAAFAALRRGSTTVTWCFAGRTGMESVVIQ